MDVQSIFAGAVPRGELFVSGVVRVPAHQVIGGKEWRSKGVDVRQS
jgi:hypothetical protein